MLVKGTYFFLGGVRRHPHLRRHYNKISATHTAKNKLDRSEKGGPNNNLVCFVKEHDLFHDQQAKVIKNDALPLNWTEFDGHLCRTVGDWQDPGEYWELDVEVGA